MDGPLPKPDLLAAWRRARGAGRPRPGGWPMALGVLWVVAGFLIALGVLMLALVAGVTLGGYLWLRRVFGKRAPPAPLAHRPRSASRPVAASWPRPARPGRPDEIVDIEAREIPDPPRATGR
ncbi:MAG: hypothetical protein ABIX46_07170 [Burkholderiaceae bacterium]